MKEKRTLESTPFSWPVHVSDTVPHLLHERLKGNANDSPCGRIVNANVSFPVLVRYSLFAITNVHANPVA